VLSTITKSVEIQRASKYSPQYLFTGSSVFCFSVTLKLGNCSVVPRSDSSSRITGNQPITYSPRITETVSFNSFEMQTVVKGQAYSCCTLFQGETKYRSLYRLNLISVNLLRFVRKTHWSNALEVAETLKIEVNRLQLSILVTSCYTELKCEVQLLLEFSSSLFQQCLELASWDFRDEATHVQYLLWNWQSGVIIPQLKFSRLARYNSARTVFL
jgi:hypothetical protein